MAEKHYNQAPSWTEDQIEELKKLSGTLSCSKIGLLLGRTKDAVKNQMVRQRIKGLPSLRVMGKNKPVKVKPEPKIKVVTPPAPPKPKPAPKVTLFNYKNPSSKERKTGNYKPLEYCPECGSPVSNWAEHFERVGHRKKA